MSFSYRAMYRAVAERYLLARSSSGVRRKTMVSTRPARCLYWENLPATPKISSWGSGDSQRTEVVSTPRAWKVSSPWLTAFHPEGTSTWRVKVTNRSPKIGYQKELPERYTPSSEIIPGVCLNPRACSFPYASRGWWISPPYSSTKVFFPGGSLTLKDSSGMVPGFPVSRKIRTPEVGDEGSSPECKRNCNSGRRFSGTVIVSLAVRRCSFG